MDRKQMNEVRQQTVRKVFSRIFSGEHNALLSAVAETPESEGFGYRDLTFFRDRVYVPMAERNETRVKELEQKQMALLKEGSAWEEQKEIYEEKTKAFRRISAVEKMLGLLDVEIARRRAIYAEQKAREARATRQAPVHHQAPAPQQAPVAVPVPKSYVLDRKVKAAEAAELCGGKDNLEVLRRTAAGRVLQYLADGTRLCAVKNGAATQYMIEKQAS